LIFNFIFVVLEAWPWPRRLEDLRRLLMKVWHWIISFGLGTSGLGLGLEKNVAHLGVLMIVYNFSTHYSIGLEQF